MGRKVKATGCQLIPFSLLFLDLRAQDCWFVEACTLPVLMHVKMISCPNLILLTSEVNNCHALYKIYLYFVMQVYVTVVGME